MRKWFNLKEILVFLFLAGLVCLFFPELVFLQKLPNCWDVNLEFYPQFHFLSNCLKQGILPLWNPYSFSGIPIFADPQSGFFNPIHLILFGLLNPGVAFGIDLSFHFLLAGWFTYLFLKQLGTNRFAAILAGICFMFSGFLVPKILIPPLVFSAIYLPFLLLSIERLYTKPNFANMVLISVGIALLILCGYPQYIMTILLFSSLYAIIRIAQFGFGVEKKINWSKSARLLAAILCILFILTVGILILFTSIPQLKNLVQLPILIATCGWSLVFILILIWLLSVNRIKWNYTLTFSTCKYLILSLILAALLSAIYLLPAFEFYQYSTRSGLPPSDYVRGIFFLQNLPTIIQDLFTGKGMNAFEISGYIGATPFVLIIFTFALGLLHTQFRKYAVIFWLFLFLSASLVFLEPHLSSFLLQYVPVVNYFFIFHRYLLISVFSLAILAGFAMHNLIEYIQKQNPVQIAKLNYSYLIPIFSGIIILAFIFSFFNETFLLLKILPGIGILLIYLTTHGQGLIRRLFPISVILISLIELHPKTVGYPLEYAYPSQLYPAKTIYTALREKDSELFRVLSIEDEKAPLPSNTAAISHFLVPNAATIYQARDIQGYNPVLLQPYREYIDYLNQGKPQRYPYEDRTHFAIVNTGESGLFDLLNVKYLFSCVPLPEEKFKLAYESTITFGNHSIPVKIYQNNHFLPNAYIVHQARVCKNFRTTLEKLTDRTFDPKTMVILNESYGTMVEKQENLIGKTKIRSPRAITVISSSQIASIQIDKQEICDNLPGYNFAIINLDTRDLEEVTSFGLEASMDTSTSNKLVQYINTIPENRMVIIAWKGNETPYLTEEISLALRTLGAEPEEITGKTFALIGVKGVKPGEAMQSTRAPLAEITVPYPAEVLYRFDEEKPILPEPENAADTTTTAIKIIKSQVELTKYSPNRISYKAILFQPGFLVLSELYYPGWVVFVDGKPTRILKVNGIFRSVFLNPGKHQVEFRYLPMSLWYGSLISSITLLGLIIIGVVRLNRKRKIE
jgi:hypothetical protein